MILRQICRRGAIKNRNRIKNTMRIFYGEWREADENHRLFR